MVYKYCLPRDIWIIDGLLSSVTFAVLITLITLNWLIVIKEYQLKKVKIFEAQSISSDFESPPKQDRYSKSSIKSGAKPKHKQDTELVLSASTSVCRW